MKHEDQNTECKKHGCPQPIYEVTAGDPGDILVCIAAAPDAIAEGGTNYESAEKTSESAEKIREWAMTAIPMKLRQDARFNMISTLVAIGMNGKSTIEDLRRIVGISDRGIRNILSSLKMHGLVVRIGPDKGGHWEIVK